jgi:hypothetical protein
MAWESSTATITATTVARSSVAGAQVAVVNILTSPRV